MLRVRDIMSTDVLTVAPQTTVREAMELLSRRHVSGAPVVSGDVLVGVVSANDLMAFAAAIPGVPTERAMLSSETPSHESSPLVAANPALSTLSPIAPRQPRVSRSASIWLASPPSEIPRWGEHGSWPSSRP